MLGVGWRLLLRHVLRMRHASWRQSSLLAGTQEVWDVFPAPSLHNRMGLSRSLCLSLAPCAHPWNKDARMLLLCNMRRVPVSTCCWRSWQCYKQWPYWWLGHPGRADLSRIESFNGTELVLWILFQHPLGQQWVCGLGNGGRMDFIAPAALQQVHWPLVAQVIHAPGSVWIRVQSSPEPCSPPLW